MALDPELLRILRCPRSRAPLIYFEDESFLYCPESRLRYEVRDDVPVMLVEEATELDEPASRELLERANALGLRALS